MNQKSLLHLQDTTYQSGLGSKSWLLLKDLSDRQILIGRNDNHTAASLPDILIRFLQSVAISFLCSPAADKPLFHVS